MTAPVTMLLLFNDKVTFTPPPPPGDYDWADNAGNLFITNLGDNIVFNPD